MALEISIEGSVSVTSMPWLGFCHRTAPSYATVPSPSSPMVAVDSGNVDTLSGAPASAAGAVAVMVPAPGTETPST